MLLDAWLAPGFRTLSGAVVRRLISGAEEWQLYDCGPKHRLLACARPLVDRWTSSGLLRSEVFEVLQAGETDVYLVASGHGYRLEQIDLPDVAYEMSDVEAFVYALTASGERLPTLVSAKAIYIERLSRILPTVSVGEHMAADRVVGAWVTGGVDVSLFATRRIRALAPWLEPADIKKLQLLVDPERSGNEPGNSVDGNPSAEGKPDLQMEPFRLPGRPALEQFFNEHVIELVRNEERYRRMGIGFPGAILLHGAPGSGKTYAVERLVDHLGWPCLSIDCGSIGSPYIHETGRKIAGVFEEAAKVGPSVVMIDEIDAFLAARDDGGSAQHRVEEVSEFLRRIPQATSDRVLVIGMTNRLAALDPAVVRRGRFDHILEVGMPSEAETIAALRNLLGDIPTLDDLDLPAHGGALAGRPLSDVGFVVREACRLAARNGRDEVGNDEMLSAIATTPAPTNAPARRIGFV